MFFCGLTFTYSRYVMHVCTIHMPCCRIYVILVFKLSLILFYKFFRFCLVAQNIFFIYTRFLNMLTNLLLTSFTCVFFFWLLFSVFAFIYLTFLHSNVGPIPSLFFFWLPKGNTQAKRYVSCVCWESLKSPTLAFMLVYFHFYFMVFSYYILFFVFSWSFLFWGEFSFGGCRFYTQICFIYIKECKFMYSMLPNEQFLLR